MPPKDYNIKNYFFFILFFLSDIIPLHFHCSFLYLVFQEHFTPNFNAEKVVQMTEITERIKIIAHLHVNQCHFNHRATDQ